MNSNTEPADETVELKKLNLTVEVKNSSACKRHVKVSIPRDDIERYFQKQFDELVPRAEMPGFRAGKAPRKLIESKFRKQVTDQVKGSLLMDSLAQVNDEKHFSAISEPDLDYEHVNVPESGPLTYEFDIEVRPEFEVPNWKGLKIKRPEHTFTDDDVHQYMKVLGKQYADLVPVDDVIKDEDEVVFNVTAFHDGKKIGRLEEVLIAVLPSVTFNDGRIEKFNNLVVGKKSGDIVTTDFQVSEYAENMELQGKKLNLEFEVLDIKRQDEFNVETLLTQFGVDTEANLKAEIRKALERQLEYAQHQEVRGQISALLTESAKWDLPQELLKKQFRRELNRALMELKSSGFSPDEIRARENILRHDAMSRTEILLKEHFILERIAEELKIEDEAEDYDFEIAKLAASSNDSPRRVRSRLEKSGQIDVLRNMIIERKVIAAIEKEAKFQAHPYALPKSKKVEALDLSITGAVDSAIPEAKFDDQPEKPIPGMAAPGARQNT